MCDVGELLWTAVDGKELVTASLITIRTAVRAATSRPVFLLAALALCIAVNFQILLPVVPVIAERAGPHGVAGAATAALYIGAVIAELSTPWLMSWQRSTHLLVVAQLLMAGPSLVYVLPHPAVWAMIAAASARGLGFGAALVISVALLAGLTAPHRRGTSIGLFGVALGAPGIVAPSIGVFLLASGHVQVDALIAFACGLVGAVVALRIPDRRLHLPRASTNLFSAIRRPGLFLVFAGVVLTSCSLGGLVTDVPLALPLNGLGSAATFFLVFGVARVVSRLSRDAKGNRAATSISLGASAGQVGGD